MELYTFLVVVAVVILCIWLIVEITCRRILERQSVEDWETIDSQKYILRRQDAEIGKQTGRICKLTNSNNELTQEISDHRKHIAKLRDDIYRKDEDLKQITVLREEAHELTFQLHELKTRGVITLESPLLERRKNETNAHFNQRCRQSVANKAAKYVKISEKSTLQVIK